MIAPLGKLIESFEKGDIRALSRAVSLVENQDPSILPALEAWYPKTGRAAVVGLTGAPGAGKSTLLDALVGQFRQSGKKVAVIAVDPVSPTSGGAVLGDRVRLTRHFNDSGVFIRSLSTRGKLGGLSLATRQVIHLLDAFGFETIFVETVGVGQSEIDVRRVADCVLLLLTPDWGDGIQAIKSGIIEIADLFVVNKADREGAERVRLELEGMLQMANRAAPITLTRADRPDSILALGHLIESFFKDQGPLIQHRREEHVRHTVLELLREWLWQRAKQWIERVPVAGTNPYRLTRDWKASHEGLF